MGLIVQVPVDSQVVTVLQSILRLPDIILCECFVHINISTILENIGIQELFFLSVGGCVHFDSGFI